MKSNPLAWPKLRHRRRQERERQGVPTAGEHAHGAAGHRLHLQVRPVAQRQSRSLMNDMPWILAAAGRTGSVMVMQDSTASF